MNRPLAALSAVFASYPNVRIDIDPETNKTTIYGSRDGVIDEIRETGTPMTSAQRGLLFSLRTRLGFSDEDRWEIATVVLRRDVTTWSDLTQYEAGRLIDTLEGFEKVSHLLLRRRDRTGVPVSGGGS